MAFNRKTIDSSADGYNVDEISSDDFESNSIFVPIDTDFAVSFNAPIDVETVSVFTNNTDIETSERGKRGSIQLSCIGDNGLGSDADSLGLRLKKQTTKPNFVETASTGALIKDETATIEVEMLNAPEVSNANSTFSISPVTKLSSNSTYVFNITTDVQDDDGKQTVFTVGTGFVTDNTRSVFLSEKPFKGSIINLPIENELKFESGEQIKKSARNLPVATILEHEKISRINYELNPGCYFINVAFTAANPCVITTAIDHGLFSDNKITVYDIVSGFGLSKRTYSIASVGTNTITLDGIDTSDGTAGRINFYVDFSADDEIVTTARSTNIQIKAISNPTKNFQDLEFNKEIIQFLPTTETTNYAKSIRFNQSENQLSYVPVTGSESNIIQGTDNFANNIILKQDDITMFVKANTNPSHNVHPFNTSAPTITDFEPDADDAITRTLEVVEITRSGSSATVLTNSIHALNVGDTIKIENCSQSDYNKTTTVQTIVDSFTFTYEVSNEPRSPATPDTDRIQIKTGSSPTAQATAFQVRFSQSMNTSTISVANATHFIYANGTSTTSGYNKTLATVQLSEDNFATSTGLVNCKSISANTGNSLFTIVPEVLLRGKSYKVKVKTSAQDLGGTNTDLDFITTNTFSTGTKSFNPATGKELVFVDNIAPRIRKISLGSSVIDSSIASEITSPEDLDSLATNLGGDSFIVQFNESMNIATVNVNSTNTDPFGSIQVSSDDFETVVQMSAQPTITTTSENNDTFTFAPSANLSETTNYLIKVTTGVADDSANKNFLENDNVSSIKVFTIGSATGDFIANETAIGTRTATVTTNSAAVTLNETFLGTTSLAKGILRAHVPGSGTLTSIEYTETTSEDGTVKEFIPGEILTGLTSGSTITTSNATITQAASGVVISYNDATAKLTMRHSNTDIAFDTTDGILTGVTSGVKGSMTAVSNAGITTTTQGLSATVSMRQADDTIVTLDSNRTNISRFSNVIVKFNQTMNVDTIVVNSTDSQVTSDHTIIFSKDSSFTNCVPLESNPTISENGTKFEFRPAILANTSLNLTQGDLHYVRITRDAKTKGGANLASVQTSSYANVQTGQTFAGINASVFNQDGSEVRLGTSDNSSKTSDASVNSPIIFHFNESINLSHFAASTGNEILIDNDSAFGSVVACTLSKTGSHGNQIIAVPNAALSSGTRFYVKANTGGQNEGGRTISGAQEFGSFTTAS